MAAVLTSLSVFVAYLQVRTQILNVDFGAMILTLVLAFMGFASLLFCLRILFSPNLAWSTKLLAIIFVALGVALLACSVILGGCSTGVFRLRINN